MVIATKSLTKSAEYRALYQRALEAAEKAALAKVPEPMVVYETEGLSDRPKPDGKVWYARGGLCGFAWVTIKPATSGFAKWLRAEGLARPAYGGGYSIWAHPRVAPELSQSVEIKEAWARAFASVLTEAGITARAESRLD